MSYPRVFATPGMGYFAEKVDDERHRQEQKWGPQEHPDGTGRPGDKEDADRLKAICQANGPRQDNWRDILAEEVGEAFAETGLDALETELIQCAAVIQNWISDIHRRRAARARLDRELRGQGG